MMPRPDLASPNIPPTSSQNLISLATNPITPFPASQCFDDKVVGIK